MSVGEARRSAARVELDERLAALRSQAAYRNYERVRDWVLTLRSSGAGERPSAYWREELETLEYLLDASPLVVETLRRHTYPVTGIRAYDYRTGKDEARRRFRRKLDALVELGGRELLVPEPPLLGGFGFELDGALYNIDTLKYYEALIALERGAVLGGFRAAPERRVVWEIGAGWGGFPYAFKTLFPDVTYVIVDLPELFLFAATYLLSAFPDARAVLVGEDDRVGPDDLLEADLVFVPSGALGTLELPRPYLTVNMVSFQEMTTEQVDAYASTAWRLESPFLYSLNRERSLYNTELESVSAVLERYYWLRTIPVLPVSYLKMLDEPGRARKAAKQGAERGELDYKHVVGTRRLQQ